MAKIAKTVRYYSPHAKQGVSVKVRDENGALVPLKDARGEQKYSQGQPQWQTRLLEFRPLVEHRTNVNECLSFYAVNFIERKKENGEVEVVPEKPEEYEALEALADDPSTKIEREDDYKRRRNPEAFEREKEVEAMKKEIEALKRSKAESQNGTKEMLAEMERLKRELEKARGRKKDDGTDLLK